MDVTVIVNYSEDDIDDIICSLDTLYCNLMGKLAKSWLYSIGCIDPSFNQEVFLYRWAIEGQPDTDLLTEEELTGLVAKIKNITCSC